MQGLKRRVVYVSLYEGIAIICASIGLSAASGEGMAQSSTLA